MRGIGVVLIGDGDLSQELGHPRVHIREPGIVISTAPGIACAWLAEAHGMHLCWAFTSGRIAGRSAAAG